MPADFPTLKSGDTPEPWHFNIIYAELRRWRKLKVTGPASVSGVESSTSPPVFTILPARRGGRVAYTTTAISPRSGSTAGTGTVQLVTMTNTNSRAISGDTNSSLTVYTASNNVTNSGNNIDNGKYCWVEWDANGIPWVGPLEC